MMPEISLNILDIAENSVRARASLVEILVCVKTGEDILRVEIKDNGCGMDENQTKKVQDPFYTTRTTRRVGLGIPFFKQAAECTGGSFSIASEPGKGTEVKAVFCLSHIDRMPLGDINETIYSLAVFHPGVDFVYDYSYDGRSFRMDTREMREILGDISFDTKEVSGFLRGYLADNKKSVDGGVEI